MTAREKLKLRLQALNHTVKKSLGQNFLVADHVIEKIITRECFIKYKFIGNGRARPKVMASDERGIF